MSILRKAGRIFGKANMAVAKATTPAATWRKQQSQKKVDPDFAGRDNVVNLRAEKDRQSYDVVIDDSGIHVGYQDKQGTTRWRKAMDVAGELTAVNLGQPPSAKNSGRVWARTYKTSGGTYTGLDAQVKHLNDLGYNVQALDKRPAKAWRSGDLKTFDRYMEVALARGKIDGKADYIGPYIDPKQAHSSADRQFRTEFFNTYRPANQHRGFRLPDRGLEDFVAPHSADKTVSQSDGKSWRKGPGTTSAKTASSTDQTRPRPKPEPVNIPEGTKLAGRTVTPQEAEAILKAQNAKPAGKSSAKWRKPTVKPTAQKTVNSPEEAPQNPQPTPQSASGKSIDLGKGVKIVEQTDVAGNKTLFTGHDGRLFVGVEDGKGRKSYFYQSFSGTGGKSQGHWYPVGGLAVDKTGDSWIVKGDMVNDKAYGRPDLADLEDHLNSVLPRTDEDTDAFLTKHGTTYGDVQTNNEKAPNVRVESFGRTGNGGKHDKTVLNAIINQWKQEHLNKVWGKRGERLNPQPAPGREGVIVPEASEPIRYTGPPKPWRREPLQIAESWEHGVRRLMKEHGNQWDSSKAARRVHYDSQTAELANRAAEKNAESIRAGNGGAQLSEQEIWAIRKNSGVPDIETMDVMPDTLPKDVLDQQTKAILAQANAQSDISSKILDSGFKATETPGSYHAEKFSKADNATLKETKKGNFAYGYEFDPFEQKGDIQLEGYQALADSLEQVNPQVAAHFRQKAENLQKQKELSATIRQTKDSGEKNKLKYQKELLVNENLNAKDQERLLGQSKEPIHGGDMIVPIAYERAGKPKYSEETLKDWDKYSGQGNESTDNTHVPGGRNQIEYSRIQAPNAPYNERLNQARSLEQQTSAEIADEQIIEKIMSGEKPDLTAEDMSAADTAFQPKEYDPVEHLANEVATRMAGLKGLVEANYLQSAGISQSQAGKNSLGDNAYAYMRKHAVQRMGAMQGNIGKSQEEVLNHYLDSLMNNPPQELAGIDPNLPQEERAAAVRSIAENIIRQSILKDIQDQASNTARTKGEPPNSMLSRISNDRSLLHKYGLLLDKNTGETLKPEDAVIQQILAATNTPGKTVIDAIDEMLLPNRAQNDPTYTPDAIADEVGRKFNEEESRRFQEFLNPNTYVSDKQAEYEQAARAYDQRPTSEAASAEEAAAAAPEGVNVAAQTSSNVPTQRGLSRRSKQAATASDPAEVPVTSGEVPPETDQLANSVLQGSGDLSQRQTETQARKLDENVLKPAMPSRSQKSKMAVQLNVGDTFRDKAGKEEFRVTAVDETTGVRVIEDGEKYGTFTLKPDEWLYVRNLIKSGRR